MATNVELRRSNGTNYNEVIHLKTSVAMVEGLLGEDDKINASLLPSFVFGGMRFVASISNPQMTTAEIRDIFGEFIDANGGTMRGCYAISTNFISIEPSEGHTFVGAEESSDPSYHIAFGLEPNDWIIAVDDNGTTWALINNAYQHATTHYYGIVKFATEQDGIDGTDFKLAMTPKSTVAAINARAYQHPTYTAKNETFSAVETLSALSVNSLGHVTSFAKQAIRVASESQTGLIQLASSSEAKAATVDTKAISPLRVKEMIDKFASIELVQSLPTDMSDHPAGKLILLQI